ncbi:hypothetical protein FRC11_004265, partial [Ceratobasidium sp. 423]
MPEPFNEPWKGESKIVLSIDIGITHSGVSLVYLENGAKPTLHSITKWPGNAASNMESMIPTLVWYDTNNEAVAFGAEALSYPIEEQAKGDGWFLAKNFKAHLYPEDSGAPPNLRISALPFGVSLRQVYSDFLGYLLRHTESYFEERIIDGSQIWEKYKPTMEIVMSHPNGWGIREQSFLRDVTVSAGYTTSELAPRSIRFVTDLEASAYCCLFNAGITSKFQIGDVFLLCDAGNSTTNVSAHRVGSIDPILKLDTHSSECLGGADSVDIVAERYMRQKMTYAGISLDDVNEFTKAGIEDFQKHVKLAFSDETKEYLVQISNARFDNPALNTRRGRMALPGSMVKTFFTDYIDIIRRAIDRRMAETGTNALHLLLVGGFGESSYLQRVIGEVYKPGGYQIVQATNATSRAVVDGALIWDISMNNGCRPRRSVGIETSCGNWLEIASKGEVMRPGTEIKKPVSLKYTTPHPKFDDFELKFLSYTDEMKATRTRDTRGVLLNGFSKWFTISANLSALSEALVQRLGANNVVHWRLNFNICVRFGETGLEAYLEWEQKYRLTKIEIMCIKRSIIPKEWYPISSLSKEDTQSLEKFSKMFRGGNRGMPQSVREPWEGDTKIVMGVDIGPTQSGVAFTFLQKGASQVIHRVTRWPGQDSQLSTGRIPTLVWYDTNARAVAFGAEALTYAIEEEAEDNGWFLAKYFKLHLHPHEMQTKHRLNLHPLPPGVTLRQIYSDFLGYLLNHTRVFFEERVVDGRQIWGRYSPTMEVVIAHPNGWGIREQAFLRSAAVAAGFSTTGQASSRIRFVTEAEASVQFCIYNSNLSNVLHPGANFAVCDAGGSTVDTALYSVISVHPVLKLEEKRASACVQAGAIFVDAEVEKFLRKTLASAGLPPDDVAEYTKTGAEDFECHAKRVFKDEMDEQWIQVSHSRFNNPTIRARRGRMSLPGSKAVADGAVLWAISQGLLTRVLSFSWGIETSVAFNPDDSEHQHQEDVSSASRGKIIPGRWKGLARKGLLLNDGPAIVTIPFSLDFPSSSTDLGKFELDLYSHSGDDEPVWMRNKQGELISKFLKAAVLQTDLETLRDAIEPQIALGGILQWKLDFDVYVRFGSEAVEAYLEWEEK